MNKTAIVIAAFVCVTAICITLIICGQAEIVGKIVAVIAIGIIIVAIINAFRRIF